MKSRAIQKAINTKKNSLKQIADIQDTETHISIDYEEKRLRIYTNRATVMNRLERLGYKHTSEDKVDGQTYSRCYEFDTKEIGSFLRTGIFKFD